MAESKIKQNKTNSPAITTVQDLREFVVPSDVAELAPAPPPQSLTFTNYNKPSIEVKRRGKVVSLAEHQRKKQQASDDWLAPVHSNSASSSTAPSESASKANTHTDATNVTMHEFSGDEEIIFPEDPDVRVFSVASDHDFFQVSSIPTVRELDKAYRNLARIMHPDKYENNEWATKAFQRLLSRYERFRATLA